MNVNRKIFKRIKLNDNDDGYVQADRAELISMIWEITKDTWSFVRGENAERRLQRDVAVLIRREG